MTPLLRRVRRSTALLAAAATVALGLAAPAAASGPALSWQLRPTGSDSHFRGLAAVSRTSAWVAGYDGVVLRTTNGGATWRDVSPRGAGTLQFRDIEAFDGRHAVAMAAGAGRDSRIYTTFTGGRHWQLVKVNRNPSAFYDCMAFFDARHGLTLSDPVNGKFRVLATDDGGRSWRIVNPAGMPRALPGEFAFAASGTCLTTSGSRDAWFGTGGGARARVFRSTDRGRTWHVTATPIRSSASAGIFSVAFRNRLQGLAIGGDYANPGSAPKALALTGDGGKTWTLVARSAAPGEYRSGATYLPHSARTALAVGPTGSDVSRNGGFSWTRFATGSFDTVQCAPDGGCWASGEAGRVARLVRR